jgi:PIN domain nuclease of toxin-antitoxin system
MIRGSRHRQVIRARDETIYVSAVSGWEIAIKVRLGKWPEAAVLLPGLSEKVRAEGFEVLDLTLAQAEKAGLLDLIHKDPFDRLLAAQSLVVGAPIATVDPAIALLGCAVM